MSDERTEIVTRLSGLLRPAKVPAAAAMASIEELRELLAEVEEAARDIERHGRLGAAWKSDDEAARADLAATAEA